MAAMNLDLPGDQINCFPRSFVDAGPKARAPRSERGLEDGLAIKVSASDVPEAGDPVCMCVRGRIPTYTGSQWARRASRRAARPSPAGWHSSPCVVAQLWAGLQLR